MCGGVRDGRRSVRLVAHVRFWSKVHALRDVRFTPKSGHWNSIEKCPLCAKSGHCAPFNHFRYYGLESTRLGMSFPRPLTCSVLCCDRNA